MEGKFLLLFSDFIQINLGSKRFQSSYSLFCSRPNFLDELARKRLLRRLHTEISDKIKQNYTENKHNSDRQENLKRFIFLRQKFTFIETRSSLNFRRLLRVVVYLNLMLSTPINVGYVLWNLTTDCGPHHHDQRVFYYSSVYRSPDHSSSILDPGSLFPIPDLAFPINHVEGRCDSKKVCLYARFGYGLPRDLFPAIMEHEHDHKIKLLPARDWALV